MQAIMGPMRGAEGKKYILRYIRLYDYKRIHKFRYMELVWRTSSMLSSMLSIEEVHRYGP